MPQRPKPAVPSTILFAVTLVMLLGVYGGGYWLSVRNADGFQLDETQNVLAPRYPIGGPVAELVFYPAYRVDRLIWPERWTFQATYDDIIALRDTPPVDWNESHSRSGSVTDPYDAQVIAGSKAHVTGDVERAIVEFTQAIEANPDGYDAYLNRGVAHQELGHWSEALADYEKARELNPDDPAAWNNIAMLLAACPDDSLRNGAKAAEYSQKACELTQWKHPAVLNTLAIAYAELGDWQAAIDICAEQIGKLGEDPMADEFRLLLELFKQEKPYRLKAAE